MAITLSRLVLEVAQANPDGLRLVDFVQKTHDSGYNGKQITHEVQEVVHRMCEEGVLIRAENEFSRTRKYMLSQNKEVLCPN